MFFITAAAATTGSSFMDHGDMPMPMPHQNDTQGHGDMMMGMAMFWNWNQKLDAVFFESWKITNESELIISCLGIFLIAFLYEGMNHFRAWLDECLEKVRRQRLAKSEQNVNNDEIDQGEEKENATAADSRAPLLEGALQVGEVGEEVAKIKGSKVHYTYGPGEQLLRSIVHAFHTFFSLFLMMVFMTYNGYLNVSLLVGAFVGFFFFHRKRNELDSQTSAFTTCCH